jgi:hypothetical protein
MPTSGRNGAVYGAELAIGGAAPWRGSGPTSPCPIARRRGLLTIAGGTSLAQENFNADGS